MTLDPTIIICTRNRPDGLATVLSSLLSIVPDELPMVIVDQSDGAETEAAIREIVAPPKQLTYVRNSPPGLAIARNEGVRRAPGDLLLFTDDDCTLAPGWVEAWCEAFSLDPSLGIGFGEVVCSTYDRVEGEIPTFDPGPKTHSHGYQVFREGPGAVGMGANMAMRRDAWNAVGGFDETLGAGARFPTGEDTDIAYRIIGRGYRLGHVVGPTVVHHGVRSWRKGSRDNPTGLGAMHAKYLRCGDVFAGRLLLLETWRYVRRALGELARGELPFWLRHLQQYCLAMVASLRVPVDRSYRLYRGRG